ncbi:MAG: hypothetical protein HRT53_09795 [Colwellia sp.]|nr:hypothetical protein [Colwellia sp.]
MAFIFSTNKLPELENFTLMQRQQILALALNKLTAPEKFILNILKLLMLVPPFLFLAQLEGIFFVFSLFGVLAIYFILLRPVSLLFTRKYLTAAIKQFNKLI